MSKYPRTYHLPWSNPSSDDKVLDSVPFYGREVVITEKMDGENFTMRSDRAHARSVDSGSQPWQTRVRALWSQIRYNIPEGWAVTGEGMQAQHSIRYEDVDPFLVFAIRDDESFFSWDETEEYAEMLGLPTVPVLWRGVLREDTPLDFDGAFGETEGYVIRLADSFRVEDFSASVAKYVRPNHVQTDVHWTKTWVENGLASR